MKDQPLKSFTVDDCGSYQNALKHIAELGKLGIEANITTGGIRVHCNNKEQAAQALEYCFNEGINPRFDGSTALVDFQLGRTIIAEDGTLRRRDETSQSK